MLSAIFMLIPTAVFAETAETAPEAKGEASLLPVKWNSGYVGSRTNGSNKNKLAPSASSSYSYSDIIIIPKAGTKIYFTDSVGSVAASSAYVFSEWKLSGSSYVLDAIEGTNVIGTASYNGIGSTKVSGGQAYEYITDKDNQAIRICYQSQSHTTPVEVYQVLTSEKSTKAQMADTNFTEVFNSDGTITGIQWFCGYTSSATNDNGSAKETKPHSADYLHSGFISVPKAGTTVSFSLVSTHAPNDAFNGITTYEKSGEGYVYLDGLAGTSTRIYTASGNTRTYTFTTSKDNEVIRVCFKTSTDGNYWQKGFNVKATWKLAGNAPTLSDEAPEFEWPDPELLSLLTGAPLMGEEIPMKWNHGYIGSQYHGSAPFAITSPNNVEYNYSDVFTVPKAGTTVYFFDETYTDYKGSQYASTSVMTVSHWKKSGNTWIFDMDKEYLDGCRAYSIIMTEHYRIYSYTTTEDNENLRLCLRQCPVDERLDDPTPPVYLVLPTDFEAKSDVKGSLTPHSYTDTDGTATDFEIYLPEDYTDDKQYTLVFDTGEDRAYSEMLAKCKYTGIIVRFNGNFDKTLRLLDEVMKKYPVCVSDLLFIGADELALHIHEFKDLRLGEALLYTGPNNVRLENISVKKASDFGNVIEALTWLTGESDNYYDILEGLTFYAIGDSYFGGSEIGQHQTWVNLFGNKYGMNYINFGLGGNTVGTYSGISSNSPAMAVRYTMMPKDGDIYILEGGRNDRSRGVPIGKNTDITASTFKGALNIMIKNIRKECPDALIIMVTAWSYKGGENPSNNDYADAMRELAEFHNDGHIVCMYAADSAWTGIEMADANVRSQYCIASNDISHLNVDGMNMVLPKFEEWIAKTYSAFKGAELTDRSMLQKFDASLANKEPEVSTATPEVTTENSNEEKGGCFSLVTLPTAGIIIISVFGFALSLGKNDN